MTRDQLGVHGRITHSQTESTPDFELRVQDGERIVRLAHAAGSKGMVEGLHLVPNELAELLVAQPVQMMVEKRVGITNVGNVRQWSRVSDPVCQTSAANHRFNVMPSGKIAEDMFSHGHRKEGARTDLGSMMGLSQGSAELIWILPTLVGL